MRYFGLFAVGAFVVALCWACSFGQGQAVAFSDDADSLATEPIEVQLMFGLPVDSFVVESYTVGKRENLGHILQRAGVGMSDVFALDHLARPVFNFNGLRQGNGYSFFFSADTLRQLMYFVYEIDARSYVRCQMTDQMNIERFEHALRIEERTASAVITSSLWKATAENSLPPMLAIELSDIFAWTVDFFGIEKGDYFKAIYEESYSDTTSLGVEMVKAALFVHHGRPYYAFRYVTDSVASYYDLEGNNLRKAFLKAPLKYSRISSRFSNGRMHPVLKVRRAHHGVDYAAPSGTPVFAIGDGQIIARGWDSKGGGNYVKIRHNSVYTSVYMHLRGFAKGVGVGSYVHQGDLIGYVGSTGMSTGPHLDFRMYMNGKAIDPLKVESPDTEPVSNDDIQAFINYSDSLRRVLDAVALKE